MVISGRAMGPDVVKALGLPANTRRVEITVDADDVVEVACWFAPEWEQALGLLELLQRYRVVPEGSAEMVANCAKGRAGWRLLPKGEWRLVRDGDYVQAGVFADRHNSLCWLRLPLSELPDNLISADDLVGAGIPVHQVDVQPG